ncbi:hypothetical protein V8C34DRAFT_295155 [Trichoderma compactum]
MRGGGSNWRGGIPAISLSLSLSLCAVPVAELLLLLCCVHCCCDAYLPCLTAVLCCVVSLAHLHASTRSHPQVHIR